MKKPAKPGTPALIPVESARQIRALRSTARQEIVDLVQAMGEASVPDLARQLGRPADALYYHVRALRAAGLLVEAGTRQRGRHTEVLYSNGQPGARLMLRYRGGRATATAPMRDLVGAMLRAARREFDLAIADPDCSTEGPRRELWPARAVGWLSPQELERANGHLDALVRLLSAPRSAKRDRLFALQFLLAPAEPNRSAKARRHARSARIPD